MGIRLKLVMAPMGALFMSMIAIAPAAAQSTQRGGAAAQAQPTILGPAMLRPGTAELSCGTGAAGLGAWGADRIEQTLTLSDTQRTKFNGLKTASERAVQYLAEGCPKNDPITPTGRLESMERRLSALLEAVRTVEPALYDFYAALSDEQKARLNTIETSKTRVSALNADKSQASAAEPANEGGDETYVDRRGRVHHRHHHGHGHFRFRLPIPLLF
jgi:hypothetical protein